MVIDRLIPIGDLCTVPPAHGAYSFLIRLKTGMDSLELVRMLVRDYKIAAIPGNAFGINDGCYLRVAYGALQPETVSQGIGRLVDGLKQITKNTK